MEENYHRCYENLANAIIWQAVQDYRNALDRIERFNRSKDKKTFADYKAFEEKHDCEKFFRSGYFGTLTKVSGEYIINKIQKEIKEKWERKYAAGSEKS